ncbi:MAG: DUF222 domain-containing protein [Acidimicrobiales bacterium]
MASEVLSLIEEADRLLRRAVGSIDADTVSGAVAEVLVARLSSVGNVASGGVTKLARRLEETARWKAAGKPSPEAHLGALTGGSMSDGRRLLETSRRLDDLPATREALERGDLSVDQAVQIASGAGALGTTKKLLAQSDRLDLG